MTSIVKKPKQVNMKMPVQADPRKRGGLMRQQEEPPMMEPDVQPIPTAEQQGPEAASSMVDNAKVVNRTLDIQQPDQPRMVQATGGNTPAPTAQQQEQSLPPQQQAPRGGLNRGSGAQDIPTPPEVEEGVAGRLTRLLESDSPYLRLIGAAAERGMNRRGLLNSSMATEAVESARIQAALPIASQDSQEANQRFMQLRDIEARYGLQRDQLDRMDEQQLRDIASREGMQLKDLQAMLDRQRIDIQSREGMQLKDIAARYNLQERDLANANEQQLRDIAAREGMQERELASLLDRQARDIASRERLQDLSIQAQERMQALDLETRELLQRLSIDAQERIANLNIAANERNQASQLAASFENSYSNLVAAIMNNPELPASARQTALNHAARMRDSNLALVEQMYGIELEWRNPYTNQPRGSGGDSGGSGGGGGGGGTPQPGQPGYIPPGNRQDPYGDRQQR